MWKIQNKIRLQLTLFQLTILRLSRRPSRLHSARVPVPLSYRPPLWCGGWQVLMWCLVDVWVSGGAKWMLCWLLPAPVKIYNKRNVCGHPPPLPLQPVRAARWQPTLWICVNFEPQRTRSAQSVFSFLDNLVDKKMKISDRIRSNPVYRRVEPITHLLLG